MTTKMNLLNSMMMALVCLLLVGSSRAQRGNDCACTPSTYEFTFDFALTCPRNGVDYPEGIAEVTCFVTSFSADVEDLVPVAVQSISIIEADLDRIPIAQSQISGEFESGDTFTYSSVSALGNSTQIPQSIQLTITGTNAANSSLVQVWAIKFTNECDVYPVLEQGGSFGWTEFSDLGTPRAEVCPAVPMAPTDSPTDSESIVIGAPTVMPTMESTDEDTAPPTTESTDEDTAPPTKAPKEKETSEPTAEQTMQPTVRPTLSPTLGPTIEAPAIEPTLEPTKGGKGDKDKDEDEDTDPPTLPPSLEAETEAPTVSPTKRPSLPVVDSPSAILDTEAPSMEMSFSYDYNLEDGDYEMGEMEWGRGDDSDDEEDKKKKKEKDSDDARGRVSRIGTRLRR